MNKEERRYQEEIKIFGKNIKLLTETKGMIQLDLADKMGMDRSEIGKIENEKKNIGFFTIVKLAVSLDAKLSDFFPTEPKE